MTNNILQLLYLTYVSQEPNKNMSFELNQPNHVSKSDFIRYSKKRSDQLLIAILNIGLGHPYILEALKGRDSSLFFMTCANTFQIHNRDLRLKGLKLKQFYLTSRYPASITICYYNPTTMLSTTVLVNSISIPASSGVSDLVRVRPSPRQRECGV